MKEFLRKNFLVFFLPIFFSCSTHFHVQNQQFFHSALIQERENNKANDIVNTYKTKVDSATQSVIAVASDALTKDGDQNTLGNFVCDALMFSGKNIFSNKKIDIVIVNRGGMRSNLPKGEIKVLNIFELMPFDNEMVLLEISGKKLKEGVKTLFDKRHSYSGMKIIYDGEKLIPKINNEVIDENTSYSILTSDYLANGGDSFLFLDKPNSFFPSNKKIREAIIDYCISLSTKGKKTIPYTDDRLQISK